MRGTCPFISKSSARIVINYADLLAIAVTAEKKTRWTLYGSVRLPASPSGASDEKDAEYEKPYDITAFHSKKPRHVNVTTRKGNQRATGVVAYLRVIIYLYRRIGLCKG